MKGVRTLKELKQRILYCGLKQKYLAQKIGVSKSMLSHVLTDRKQLSKEKMQRLIEIVEKHEQLNT